MNITRKCNTDSAAKQIVCSILFLCNPYIIKCTKKKNCCAMCIQNLSKSFRLHTNYTVYQIQLKNALKSYLLKYQISDILSLLFIF